MYFEWMNEDVGQDTSFPKDRVRELPLMNPRGTRDNMTERRVALLGLTGLLWSALSAFIHVSLAAISRILREILYLKGVTLI